MMLAPVLTHITGGNPAVQKTTPPLAVSSGDGDEILQRSTFDRHAPGPDAMPSVSWELPVRPREGVGGPFAAELDVINQRAHNSGPTRRAGNIEPDSRRRDTRETERENQRLPSYHDEHRLNSSGYNSQHTLQEVHRPKLATFDGSDDRDSFLLPFECQVRKYGWSAAEKVDRLHECLRGAAIRYV